MVLIKKKFGNTEIISLAKYLASSRSEFTLSEMKQYLSKKYEEKEIYAFLKPHLFDLDLFCDDNYKCTKLTCKPNSNSRY